MFRSLGALLGGSAHKGHYWEVRLIRGTIGRFHSLGHYWEVPLIRDTIGRFRSLGALLGGSTH